MFSNPVRRELARGALQALLKVHHVGAATPGGFSESRYCAVCCCCCCLCPVHLRVCKAFVLLGTFVIARLRGLHHDPRGMHCALLLTSFGDLSILDGPRATYDQRGMHYALLLTSFGDLSILYGPRATLDRLRANRLAEVVNKVCSTGDLWVFQRSVPRCAADLQLGFQGVWPAAKQLSCLCL